MTAVGYNIMLHTLDTLAGKISPGSVQTSPGSQAHTALDTNANRVHPYSKHAVNNNNNNTR